MPETPDFEEMARRIPQIPADLIADVAERLRLVWVARGAVDTVTIERELSMMMGATASGPYLKNLNRALRTLDR